MTLLETNLEGHCPNGRGRSATSMTSAIDCSWSPLIASVRLTGSCPTPIPDKGRVLTSLSAFWFEFLDVPNHLISTDVDDLPIGYHA